MLRYEPYQPPVRRQIGIRDNTPQYRTCGQCEGSGKIGLQCPGCRGHGVKLCNTCNGKRRQECRVCEGEGYFMKNGQAESCSVCSGVGTRVCSSCGGDGGNICTSCNGSGSSGHSYSCVHCMGNGYVKMR